MDKISQAIDRIINAIDWHKIKDYHKKLGIYWEYVVDKETVRKLPTIADLKGELRSIIHHMKDEELAYISYGSWVVFWERNEEPIGDIRVIFRLADFHFEENRDNRESLEEALRKAIEKEDYEHAAILHDALTKKQTKK